MRRTSVSSPPRVQTSSATVTRQQQQEVQPATDGRQPWWRHPFMGYPVSVLLVGLSLLLPLTFTLLNIQNGFLGAPLYLTTVIVALIWGRGPALFSIVLGTLALDYFFLPPYDNLRLERWQDALPLVPFLVANLALLLITAQGKTSRRRLHASEQKALQTARDLQQANQLKDQFLSMVSHEFKTPLTTIRLHAQLGQRLLTPHLQRNPDLATASDSLGKIEKQSEHLNLLVNDLLDLNTLRAGKMVFSLHPCDLGELCRSTIDDLPLTSGRVIDLDLPSVPVRVQGESERLRQVILNLLTNALKYSPAEAPILVRVSLTHHSPGEALLLVHNDGPPIPPEDQPHLFEFFFRAPGARTSSQEGSGLGLAISKELVERQNGRLWFESSEGKGTTFFVTFPFA